MRYIAYVSKANKVREINWLIKLIWVLEQVSWWKQPLISLIVMNGGHIAICYKDFIVYTDYDVVCKECNLILNTRSFDRQDSLYRVLCIAREHANCGDMVK